MTTRIRHIFASAVADGADATLVQPGDWNDNHNPYLNKTNRSGAAVVQYAVLVNDPDNNDSIETTTTANDPRPAFVVQDAAGIADAAAGNVLGASWDTTINVQGNVTRGNWLVTSTTAGRAADSGVAATNSPPAGTLGVATSAYSGGGAGTVTCYLLNGTAQEAFTSTDQTVTAGGSLTLAHGLGTTPTELTISLVCAVAENGYSVGDVVFVNAGLNAEGTANRGVSVVPDATNLNVRFGNGTGGNVFNIPHKTTGNASTCTAASWTCRFKAKV